MFKEVKFSAQLINGLTMFNQPALRQNVAYDKPFIKALIIGICTVQSIQNEECIHKDFIKFVRELFLIRIEDGDENGTRYLSFNKLLDVSCIEIRNNNFM